MEYRQQRKANKMFIINTDYSWLTSSSFEDWVVEEAKRIGAWDNFADLRDFEMMLLGN
jgi:hypothetical protein